MAGCGTGNVPAFITGCTSQISQSIQATLTSCFLTSTMTGQAAHDLTHTHVLTPLGPLRANTMGADSLCSKSETL